MLIKINFSQLTHQAGIKQIQIENRVPDYITVSADRNMLSLVIRNLISNSIKFTHAGGKIDITAIDTGDGFVKATLQDNGIGMSPDLVEELFKIDKRVSRPGTEGEPSSGLGLLLCHEFIQKHGGTMIVESEENVGTSFHFTLPVAQ